MANLVEISPKKALSLNDLADLEEKYGAIDKVDFNKFAVLRYVLWLAIKRNEPGVDEREVGDRFDIKSMQETVTKVLRDSGLLPDEPEEGEQVGKAVNPA
jgi:hypothetical protein